MIGIFATYLSLFSGLMSILAYIKVVHGDTKRRPIARIGLTVSAFGIFLASVVLMSNILGHNFESAYVWSYSSRDLSTALLISTFWAGQEGSFLFWAFCSAVLSLLLLSYTQKRKLEEYVLPIFLSIQTFLVILLIVKSPFKTIFQQFPGELAPGQIPHDGRGLNPLLQNFWMVIHPPVLFIGFAASAIPFSFAIAALWKKDFHSWLTNTFPWVLFSGLTLGAGLMLGAYWAYGVLGWGGYWGWDPVENSSLVPWIISMALLHTMLVQTRTGNLVRTNFLFAILSFVMVIYSTFLTRSGILGDSSVHSFTDPGTIVYGLLLVFLFGSIVLGFGFFFIRYKEMTLQVKQMHWLTREFALAIGSFVLLASAAIVCFGTSLPLFSSTQVDPSFYNKMHVPIAIIITLLIGYSLFVRWEQEDGTLLKEKSWKSLLASFAGTILIGIFSTWSFLYLLFIFAALCAFSVNLEIAYLTIRGDFRLLGGKITHMGLAVFFIGVMISGMFDQKKTAMLELGKPQEIFGYTVTYNGKSFIEKNKTAFTVNVQKDGTTKILLPVMIETENSGTMRNPDMESFLTHDFYLSPTGVDEQKIDASGAITIPKGESVTIGTVSVKFSAFDMGSHNQQTNGKMRVGVVLEITSGTEKETVTPYVEYDKEPKYSSADSKLLGSPVQLIAMNIGGMGDGKSIIQISVKNKNSVPVVEKKETLVVEASLKPFISLVWVGTLMVLTGFVIAILRRKRADVL
jgi:cytochrome c-type biogenesis protein CcmF